MEGTDTPYEKGKKIINKPAANGVSTLLWGKEEIKRNNYSRNEQWYSIVARWAVGLTMITQVKGPE